MQVPLILTLSSCEARGSLSIFLHPMAGKKFVINSLIKIDTPFFPYQISPANSLKTPPVFWHACISKYEFCPSAGCFFPASSSFYLSLNSDDVSFMTIPSIVTPSLEAANIELTIDVYDSTDGLS